MFDQAKLTALRLLPKNMVSRAVGALAEIPLPELARGPINTSFAKLAGVNLDEAEQGPAAYRSVNAFFTRRLKEGARSAPPRLDSELVSPADGKLSTFGKITHETLVQAKGRHYRLVDLLDSGRDAEAFRNGHWATIYLSPRDYHRVHSPANGLAKKIGYIPGHLFPVNPLAVANVDQLFAVNERLVTLIRQPSLGDVGVVMVGATCVGKMTLAFHDITTNGPFRRREEIELGAGIEVRAGSELGMFNLGSTVVILIGAEGFHFRDDLRQGMSLLVGDLLGSVG